jgi:hypothetical protein
MGMLKARFATLLPSRRMTLQCGILFAACAVLACSGQKFSATTTDSSAGAVASSEEGTGSGHLRLTGDVTLDHDFVVDGCQIAPPGAGLLSGYHMTAKNGDSTITMLSIVLKDYDKDGPYSPVDKSAEAQVGKAMSTGVMGPLSLMVVQPNSPMPLAVMLKPASKLVINISGNGAQGDAQFSDMESPITFADIDPKSTSAPHGKIVSGSVSWKCGKVDHLNAQMNNAVNGMFNKLIPSR